MAPMLTKDLIRAYPERTCLISGDLRSLFEFPVDVLLSDAVQEEFLLHHCGNDKDKRLQFLAFVFLCNEQTRKCVVALPAPPSRRWIPSLGVMIKTATVSYSVIRAVFRMRWTWIVYWALFRGKALRRY